MPFKSEAQRRWMYANEPEMAKRWERHTPKGKKLPEKKATRIGDVMSQAAKSTFTSASDPDARRQAFKVGFLKKLAEEGVRPGQFMDRLAKSAFLDVGLSELLRTGREAAGGGLGMLGSGLQTAGQAALLAPLVLGAATGTGEALLTSPSVEDIETLRKAEILQLYKRLAAEARARVAKHVP